MTKTCQDRVVIITGAGGGLGRAYALTLAQEGAKVVVNDINQDAADEVVEMIGSMGGEAISNNSDITDYADSGKAIEQTIKRFGGLHAVINNAGINRDRMFVSTTEAEWDAVIAVHLKGHFCLSSHASQYWREQSKAGHAVKARILNTSSGAGLQGSVGQSNYAAAKGGIASLTLVQAEELGRYGITANTIVPAARTGMTEDVFADMMKKPEAGGFDYYDPANVASIVAYLVSEASQHVTGKAFEAEGGKLSISDGWKTTTGVDKKARWLPGELGKVVDELIAKSVPAQKVYGAK